MTGTVGQRVISCRHFNPRRRRTDRVDTIVEKFASENTLATYIDRAERVNLDHGGGRIDNAWSRVAAKSTRGIRQVKFTDDKLYTSSVKTCARDMSLG